MGRVLDKTYLQMTHCLYLKYSLCGLTMLPFQNFNANHLEFYFPENSKITLDGEIHYRTCYDPKPLTLLAPKPMKNMSVWEEKNPSLQVVTFAIKPLLCEVITYSSMGDVQNNY